MSEERKREIAEAMAAYEGDFWKDPWFKIFHTTAARCNCTKEEFRIVTHWLGDGAPGAIMTKAAA